MTEVSRSSCTLEEGNWEKICQDLSVDAVKVCVAFASGCEVVGTLWLDRIRSEIKLHTSRRGRLNLL